MARKKERWSLDRRQVTETRSAGVRTHKGSVANRSRADRGSVGPGWVRLVHRETGIEVSEEIPVGRYTRDELRRLQDDAIEHLYSELEAQVARALRIPGRSN